MNKLQEITIKVLEKIAQAYREAMSQKKQKNELNFATLMKLKINYNHRKNS